MATEIVISNGDYIKVDNFYIKWADKGDSMPALPSGQPGDNNIHYNNHFFNIYFASSYIPTSTPKSNPIINQKVSPPIFLSNQ